MKKIYQTPTIHVVNIQPIELMAGSVKTDYLDGFEGYGGDKNTGSADSRFFDFEMDDVTQESRGNNTNDFDDFDDFDDETF